MSERSVKVWVLAKAAVFLCELLARHALSIKGFAFSNDRILDMCVGTIFQSNIHVLAKQNLKANDISMDLK